MTPRLFAPFLSPVSQSQEPAKQTRSSTGSSSSLTSPPGDKSPRLLRTLCYWCLLPGLAMEQLAKLEVQTMIMICLLRCKLYGVSLQDLSVYISSVSVFDDS